MDIIKGGLYFVDDSFFEKINDPFLKINYNSTDRPHYYAYQDPLTSLYWLVPCSSQIEKFENIIRKKKIRHTPADGIKIIKIQGRKTVLLFQDMFPATKQYIREPYMRNGRIIQIIDPKIIQEFDKHAKKVISLFRHGVRFTPTQPDVLRIEKLMLAEPEQPQKAEPLKNTGKKPSLLGKVEHYKNKIAEQDRQHRQDIPKNKNTPEI